MYIDREIDRYMYVRSILCVYVYIYIYVCIHANMGEKTSAPHDEAYGSIMAASKSQEIHKASQVNPKQRETNERPVNPNLLSLLAS